jgi:arsenate reductase (thioredoxin)
MSARILFVCSFNSARSQMAEGLARALVRDGVEVASAGTHATRVSPFAIEAMRRRGLDISKQWSKVIDDVAGEFDYVITLCDEADRECPLLGARIQRMHWPHPDPAREPGTDDDRQRAFEQVRDNLEARLREWLGERGMLGERASGARR